MYNPIDHPMKKCRLFSVSAGAILAFAACSGSDTRTASDTIPADSIAATTSMDHSDMPGMNRPPAMDADHEFLRMMVDHHEGLIRMAVEAMTKASTPQVQGDAHTMHTKQLEEQKQMQAMVTASYGEQLMPMVIPTNQAMLDSLQQETGTGYDRTFYRLIVQHHREALEMIQDFRPRVQRADVRQMMTTMESDQGREIGELEAKLARLR